jgi:hypothetical protein
MAKAVKRTVYTARLVFPSAKNLLYSLSIRMVLAKPAKELVHTRSADMVLF